MVEAIRDLDDRGNGQQGRQRHSLAGQGAVEVGGDVLGVQEAAGQVQGAAGPWTSHHPPAHCERICWSAPVCAGRSLHAT